MIYSWDFFALQLAAKAVSTGFKGIHHSAFSLWYLVRNNRYGGSISECRKITRISVAIIVRNLTSSRAIFTNFSTARKFIKLSKNIVAKTC